MYTFLTTRTPVFSHVQVVVCTSATLKQANEYDAFCRAQKPPIPFIYAKTAGVFGQVFCDFGPEFVIFDTDGAACGCTTSLPTALTFVMWLIHITFCHSSCPMMGTGMCSSTYGRRPGGMASEHPHHCLQFDAPSLLPRKRRPPLIYHA